MDRRTFAGAGVCMRLAGFAAVVMLAWGVLPAHARTQKTVTLNDALTRAANAGFILPAARARGEGAAAGVYQAGRYPNPLVGVETNNIAGSGPYRGLGQLETTFFLQQTIELGGKRAARTGVAQSEAKTTKARSAIQVLDLMREVEMAWIEVLVTAAQLRVAEQRLSIAQQVQREISRRETSGRDPLYTQSRAAAQVALDQIAVDQARALAGIARANLAGYWRGSADFSVDLASFEDISISKKSDFRNADMALLEAERDLASARVTLERSKRTQDPSLRVGVRHFSDTRDTALVAGISIPLALFDTNSGNIQKALAERRAADLDLETSRMTLRRELTRLRARLQTSASEAHRIRREVIPKAEQAVQLIHDGMDRGAFSYIEFADAQRTLNDARMRRIEAIRAFYQDNATLARLTGRHARLNIKGWQK